MAHRHKKEKEKKMAKGGKTKEPKEHFITGEGSPEAHEAEEKEDGFKRGGKTKKLKSGGHVSEKKAHHHLGKAKRGGKMAKGGSPLTAAHKMSGMTDGGAGRGYQSDGPKGEDTTAE
jgi:hypothetical protein